MGTANGMWRDDSGFFILSDRSEITRDWPNICCSVIQGLELGTYITRSQTYHNMAILSELLHHNNNIRESPP